MKEFKDNDEVLFGDINLREARVSGPPYNPGQGGWPTVRYFNKETGPDGAPYSQVTSDAMCTELGPGKPHLSNLVKQHLKDAPGEGEAADPPKEEL